MTSLDGFVNIIKPTGMTSFEVVSRVKKLLNTKKVGHLGTLDPAASGVLPIAVGRATKFFNYFLNKDKEYVALVQFGIETDSLDSFGKILSQNDKIISFQELEEVIQNFIGEIYQVPPKYSAIKINGKRAYDLARENKDFDIKPRKISIFSIKTIKNCGNNMYLFKVHCSAGTYIRTLFYDIAQKLKTVSNTPVIIRTKSGCFYENNAITLDEFEKNRMLQSIDTTLYNIKKVSVDEKTAKKLINGVKTSANTLKIDIKEGEEIFIYYENSIIGLFKIFENQLMPLIYLYKGE